MDLSNCKIFELNKHYYIYSAHLNDFAEIDENMASYLLSRKKEKNICVENDIVLLEDMGFFKPVYEEMMNPITPYLFDLVSNKIQHITLNITQSCNFKCRYCVYANKNDFTERNNSSVRMELQTIIAAIEFLNEHSSGISDLYINFYGGEPILEFQLIQKAIDFAKKTMPHKNLHYQMTTNLSYINDDILKCFVDNNINLVVSIDGPQEIHNANRRFLSNGEGTFDVVYGNILKLFNFNKTYFKEHVYFNCVINNSNQAEEIQTFFSAHPFELKNVSLSREYTNLQLAQEDRTSSYDRDSEKFRFAYNFLSEYIKKTHLPSPDMYILSSEFTKNYTAFARCLSDRKTYYFYHHAGPCIPGQSKLFVRSDGSITLCENINENSKALQIGTVFDGLDYNKIKEIANFGQITKEECKKCWAVRFCSICPMQVDNISELSREVNKSLCQVEKRKTMELMKEYLSVYLLVKRCVCDSKNIIGDKNGY